MNRGVASEFVRISEVDPERPVVQAEFLEAFDPNQPRDEHGRWTGTGGEKGGGSVMEPSRPIRRIAERYMRRSGLHYVPPRARAVVNVKRAARIANEYDKMKHDPHDPEVKAAYDALIKETMAQFQVIKATGLKMEPYPEKGDPYAAGPKAVINDVRDNNHLYFFPTAQGFGSDAKFDASENPLLAKTDEKIGDHPMLVNDVFRLVHDYFGHVKEGNGFRADGEENAWRSHSTMYSKPARRAMTTETRGQNSWVNFGPQGAKNRFAKSAADTIFADQKVGLLPTWVSEEGVR